MQAFSKIGLIPDTGGTWFLPQRVGMARAMGLAMLADKLPAEKAEQWGLIWQAVDDAELAATVDKLAAQLAQMPTHALVAHPAGHARRAQSHAGAATQFRGGLEARLYARDFKGWCRVSTKTRAEVGMNGPRPVALRGQIMQWQQSWRVSPFDEYHSPATKHPRRFGPPRLSYTQPQPLPSSCIVAVIGAGAMGAGIAQVAASAGHSVWLLDTRADAAAQAITGIRAQFDKMATKGKLSPTQAQAARQRLHVAHQLADLADAGLVVEAIVESLPIKHQLFADLEALVSEDCILASNTSSISITAIGAALKHPERVAGLHFFNPAPLMALVEVVSGLATRADVADTLHATATAWGKTAVFAKSTPGFIVNRVARPFYGEALRVLHEGGADCATLDAVMREAGGFRMGPFELMDLIGLDVNYAVTCSVWQAYFNDPRYTPSLIQRELTDAGFLGKKSGRGFYDYRAGAEKPVPKTETTQAVPAEIAISGDSEAAQALAQRLSAASVPFTHAASSDGRIAQAGQAVLFVTDGRTATRRAAETQTPNTVLIDLALDYNQATRLAIGVAHQCETQAALDAIGLLQAAGFAASRLQDIPGLIVMRTVVMLANEAADAVNQGVCDVAAVDAAMQLGVNYPCGPLAWANAIGLKQISSVLARLALTYGEDRYRTSPFIQQLVFAQKAFHD